MPKGDNRQCSQRFRYLRRQVRETLDPFDISDALFVANYRLSKNLTKALIQEVRLFLKPDDKPQGVPNAIKVLCVLNFYATGCYQGQISCNWLNCLGRSTVGVFIEEVTEALNVPEIQRRHIKFPKTREERRPLTEMWDKLHERAFHISGIIGFIDGTEIPITTPPAAINPQSFWTRKHHYALNCQVVCDSNLIILNVNASHAGAANDAFIYKFSAVRKRMMAAYEEKPPCWLLGDSAYPNEPWLLTPSPDADEGTPQYYYTKCHCSARCCVERCFGVLKGRFRCLLRERRLQYTPQRAAKIMKACCLLLNLCRKATLPDIILVEDEENAPPFYPNGHTVESEDEEEGEEELSSDEEPVAPGPQNVTKERNPLLRQGRAVRDQVIAFLQAKRDREEE